MVTGRRQFMLGAASSALLFYGEACAAAAPVVSPEQYGAAGNGLRDDTAAIQQCIDRAPAGAVIRLRPGAVYMVDTNARPTLHGFGGLKLRSGQTLELNGAELRALPTRQVHGAVIQGFRTSGWAIKGPGKITGERQRHIGREGEWGMGIAAFSSSGWRIEGVEVANCWGDGIYVGTAAPGTFCEAFLISGVRVSNCRRNGISVVAGRGGRIASCDIRDINGTAPQGGIDLEPDNPAHPNRNITIEKTRIHGDLQVGIYVTVANENIVVDDVDAAAANTGILIGDGARGVRITGSRIRSRVGGAEGAAIRAVGKPSSIRSIHIRGNSLDGGGHFVVDFWGEGYRDVVVADNRITASNRGTQGIARVHHSTFTGNDCLIDAAAGKAGDYFVHLQGTAHGRNRYRNRSRSKMTAVMRGGRNLGGDVYEGPSLTSYFEPI